MAMSSAKVEFDIAIVLHAKRQTACVLCIHVYPLA